MSDAVVERVVAEVVALRQRVSHLEVLESSGAPAAAPIYLNFVIDGGGAAITAGEKGYVRVPRSTVTAWSLFADQPGNIVVDLWRSTYATFPPSDVDSLCPGAEPQLSSAQAAEDTDLSDWADTTLDEGDILAINVDSADTVQRVTLCLRLER